jgi:hypothetical protein
MIYHLTNLREADQILKYFNYFHEGFIKRLNISAQDEFDDTGAQNCYGTFDVGIDFAHYNYDEGKPAFDNIVRAYFYDVRGICLDLREMKEPDWSIHMFSVLLKKRPAVAAGDESCFAARLILDHLYDEKEWGTKEIDLFTFKEATFESHESTPPG